MIVKPYYVLLNYFGRKFALYVKNIFIFHSSGNSIEESRYRDNVRMSEY